MYDIDKILKEQGTNLKPYLLKRLIKAYKCLSFELLNELINEKYMSFTTISEEYKLDRKMLSILAKQIYKIKVDAFKIKSNSFAYVRNSLPVSEVINLYLNQGKSCRQIAEIYGVNHDMISILLQNNDIGLRSAYDEMYYIGDNKRQADSTWQVNDNGYIFKRPYGKHIYQHREVMESYLHRKLIRGEVVHHIDLSTDNNNIFNLFVFKSNSQHIRYHGYINQNEYVTPQYYLDNIYIDDKELLTYSFLHREYIVLNKSANQIHKENGISRALITKRLNDYEIWNLKPVQTSKIRTIQIIDNCKNNITL